MTCRALYERHVELLDQRVQVLVGRLREQRLQLDHQIAGAAAVMTPATELCRAADVDRLLPQVTLSPI